MNHIWIVIAIIMMVSGIGVMGFSAHQAGKKGIYILLGVSFKFIGILLHNVNIIYPLVLSPLLFLNSSVLAQIVCFGIAIGYKIRLDNKEKEEAQAGLISQLKENQVLQNKVNLELEQKVKERTAQIEVQSQALFKMNKELSKINEEMGAINIELKEQSEEIAAQRDALEQEKDKSDNLLLNILPHSTANELKETGKAIPRFYEQVSVMFIDFKNFTLVAEKLSPDDLLKELNHYFVKFDLITKKFGIEKIKTIGDAYMCASGLPEFNEDCHYNLVKAAIEIQKFAGNMKEEREHKNLPFWELRIGIHTGPVVAGVIGLHKFAYDVWGDTVNIAARMESSGETGKINVSGETYEVIKNQFLCSHRGKIQAKNKGEVEMYFVEKELIHELQPIRI
jgi:class 3 adenylate cyclase